MNLQCGLRIDFLPKAQLNRPTELSFTLLVAMRQMLAAYNPKLKELSEFLEISSVNDYDIDESIQKQLVVQKRSGGMHENTFRAAFAACGLTN